MKDNAKPKSAGRANKPGKRSPRLDRDGILAEAVAMADAAGLESLTMRALATRLRVEAMSLYHHVANKDALIDGMVDRIVGEIPLPDPARPWLSEMRQRAHAALAVLMRHPWAPMPILSRIHTGPNMLAHWDRTHGCLLAAGFDHEGADRAHHLIDNHIYGYALQELHFPLRPEDYASSAESFLPQIPTADYPHLRGIAEAVAAGDYDGRNSFDFGLEIILEGLDRLARPTHLGDQTDALARSGGMGQSAG